MRRYVFRLALLSLAVFGPNAVFGDDQQIAQQIRFQSSTVADQRRLTRLAVKSQERSRRQKPPTSRILNDIDQNLKEGILPGSLLLP